MKDTRRAVFSLDGFAKKQIVGAMPRRFILERSESFVPPAQNLIIPAEPTKSGPIGNSLWIQLFQLK